MLCFARPKNNSRAETWISPDPVRMIHVGLERCFRTLHPREITPIRRTFVICEKQKRRGNRRSSRDGLVSGRVRAVMRTKIWYSTGISTQIRSKLRDWAVWQARAGLYSQAALSSNDSKTLYMIHLKGSPSNSWP